MQSPDLNAYPQYPNVFRLLPTTTHRISARVAQTLDILENLGLIRQDERDGQTFWYAAELQQTA